MSLKSWQRRVAALLLAGSMTTTVISVPASASTKQRITCATASEVGTQVPAVMVHGWHGSQDNWTDGPHSMSEALATIQGIKPTYFNYPEVHHEWVTHPEIGDKLAEYISCLAAASRKGGGHGKVIVIGHSMGGLAAQLAVSQTAPYVDLVFTLGTPYKGSVLANGIDIAIKAWCLVNPAAAAYAPECKSEVYGGLSAFSKQAAELPPWPDRTGVVAMASNVKLPITILDGWKLKQVDVSTGSDLVVPTKSALASGKRSSFDSGSSAFSCRLETPLPKLASCWHSGMMNHPPIQRAVKQTIENYLAYLRGTTIQFAGLTLTVPTSWKVTDRADNYLKVEDRAHCGTRESYGASRDWCPWFMVYKAQGTNDFGNIQCDNDPNTDVKMQKFTVAVGGIRTQEYLFTCPSDPAKYAFRYWSLPSKKVIIQGEDGGMLDSRLPSAQWN
jgi:pimeloyl-ACP methyl ester carboxylesterase